MGSIEHCFLQGDGDDDLDVKFESCKAWPRLPVQRHEYSHVEERERSVYVVSILLCCVWLFGCY